MKSHPVSSKRRTQRKLQLTAPSSIKRRLMSCHLNKSLWDQYKIRCLPIKRRDEVKILKGKSKGKVGKVVQVFRWRNVRPCHCVIEKTFNYKDRTKTIERRAALKTKAAEKYKA